MNDDVAKVFGSGFDNRIAIYVPGTNDVDRVLNKDAADALTNRALRFMSEAFGGATAFSVTGGWIASDGRLVVEPINIVYSFSGELTSETLTKVRAFAQGLKAELLQESIAIEINGSMFFL